MADGGDAASAEAAARHARMARKRNALSLFSSHLVNPVDTQATKYLRLMSENKPLTETEFSDVADTLKQLQAQSRALRLAQYLHLHGFVALPPVRFAVTVDAAQTIRRDNEADELRGLRRGFRNLRDSGAVRDLLSKVVEPSYDAINAFFYDAAFDVVGACVVTRDNPEDVSKKQDAHRDYFNQFGDGYRDVLCLAVNLDGAVTTHFVPGTHADPSTERNAGPYSREWYKTGQREAAAQALHEREPSNQVTHPAPFPTAAQTCCSKCPHPTLPLLLPCPSRSSFPRAWCTTAWLARRRRLRRSSACSSFSFAVQLRMLCA
jgi:hypothetical protein